MSSAAERQYQRHHAKYTWLTLHLEGEEAFLGCCLCQRWAEVKHRGLFGSGRYLVGKYFYDRTLRAHANTSVHRNCLQLSQLEEEPAAAGDAVTPEKCRPCSSSSEHGSPVSYKPSARELFSNMLLGIYMILHAMQSSQTFQLLTTFGRLTRASLPSSHDSFSVFDEGRNLIADMLREELKKDMQSSFYALSVDEKDAKLVVICTWLTTRGTKEAQPIGYCDLPGGQASDIFLCIKNVMTEWEVPPQSCLAFTADGASVMGVRKALSGGANAGDNVAKRLEEFCGSPLLITHCAPHRLQPLGPF